MTFCNFIANCNIVILSVGQSGIGRLIIIFCAILCKMKCDMSPVKKHLREKPCIIVGGLALIILCGAFGWILVPKLITWQILKRIAISPDINPELYDAWIEPPVPIYLKVYLFNCTNPNDVENGMLPALAELGPYVFLEKRKKVNVHLDDSSDTATYKEHITYHFVPEQSNGNSLDQVLTIINVPYAGAALQISRDFPWPLSDIAHTMLANYKEPLFVQKTVDEILFKGWKVPYLEKIEEGVGLTMLPNNTFSFFMGLNNTNQGPYAIKRGLHGDKNLYGTVVQYKNRSSLNFWGDEDNYCNKIYGTDGTIYPPFVGKDTHIKFFNAEVCRSVYLTFSEEENFEGIPAYRFRPPREGPEQEFEDSKCFCGKDTSVVKCLRGAADMAPCRDGAPVAMSMPHFYGGSNVLPEYLEMIEGGWKPEEKYHETFVDIEPTLGILVQASKKVQINLILKKVKPVKSLRKVRNLLFPLFWADETAYLDEKMTNRVKTILFQIHAVEYSAKFLAILVATIIPAILLYQSMTSATRRMKPHVNTGKQFNKDASVDKNELPSSLLLTNDGK